MQQTLLPATLLRKAIKAEIKSISDNKLYIVKKHIDESFLHHLFFEKQPLRVKTNTEIQIKWNDPNEFSSYE